MVLLPASARLADLLSDTDLAKALGRSDRLPDAASGETAQLHRYFSVLPVSWPIAAIQRQFDAGDAAMSHWLRADPCWLRADLTTAHLAGWGNLALTDEEADALLKPLKPIFGDAGFPISRTVADRWYLQLPINSQLPIFTSPSRAFGDDVLTHMPQGNEARRWRSLLNEAQVVLHNHPLNAKRVAEGKPPVNSVWFWGGGKLPDQVRCSFERVVTSDKELQAVCRAAGAACGQDLILKNGSLIDARAARDVPILLKNLLIPAMQAIANRKLSKLLLDFADGKQFVLLPSQRWRLWRRPLRILA